MYEAHEEGEERAGHHQGGAQVQHLMVPVTEHVSHNLQERGKMIKSLIIRNNTIDYLLLGLAAVTVQQRDGYKFHGEYGRTWPPPSSCLHVRADLLQLPDPDTLGQGLDI